MTIKKYWIIVIAIIITVPFAFNYISSLKSEVKKNEKVPLPIAFVQEVKNQKTDLQVYSHAAGSPPRSLPVPANPARSPNNLCDRYDCRG